MCNKLYKALFVQQGKHTGYKTMAEKNTFMERAKTVVHLIALIDAERDDVVG